MRTLIQGGWVVGYDGRGHELIPNGAVVYEDDRVIHVGRAFDGRVDRTLNASGKLVSPGFINCHLHAAGGVGLGALMISAALAARRGRRIPAWATWVSIVFGILAVFSIFFIPLFLNAIWLLAAGLLLFMAQPEPTRAPQPA